MHPIHTMQNAFQAASERGQKVKWHQGRVETRKREMFSQKSVRRFVGDSSTFVMGAMLLASALTEVFPPGISNHF